MHDRTAALSSANTELAREIAERQRAEAALRESESKWRQLVHTTPDVICSLDRQGTILFINRPTAGAQRVEELVGTSAFDYVLPEHHAVFRRAVEYVFETGQPTNYEVSARGLDGIMRWYASHVGPVLVNERVTAVTVIAADVTVRGKPRKTSFGRGTCSSRRRRPCSRPRRPPRPPTAPRASSWPT